MPIAQRLFFIVFSILLYALSLPLADFCFNVSTLLLFQVSEAAPALAVIRIALYALFELGLPAAAVVFALRLAPLRKPGETRGFQPFLIAAVILVPVLFMANSFLGPYAQALYFRLFTVSPTNAVNATMNILTVSVSLSRVAFLGVAAFVLLGKWKNDQGEGA